jgi:hypothetical protein
MINITPSQNHLGLKRFKFQIESDDGPGLYSNEEKATERTIHTYIHTYIHLGEKLYSIPFHVLGVLIMELHGSQYLGQLKSTSRQAPT